MGWTPSIVIQFFLNKVDRTATYFKPVMKIKTWRLFHEENDSPNLIHDILTLGLLWPIL